jgi:hypothetical protein
MAVWDELKLVLAGLRDQQPGTLTMYPMLDGDTDRQPPFPIRLAPWATTVAKELHQQFGDDINLTVGSLPYPPNRQPPDPPGRQPRRPRTARPPAELLDPNEITVELAGPAVVSSGHTLRHGLLLTNLTASELQIATNGKVTAKVVDPRTGEVVGGFAGAQNLPLIFFRVAPGESKQVPLLIGTASSTLRLGYAIPPGDWGIQATLSLGPDPRNVVRRRTPILPLSITA